MRLCLDDLDQFAVKFKLFKVVLKIVSALGAEKQTVKNLLNGSNHDVYSKCN
jgi:hypothetical protein